MSAFFVEKQTIDAAVGAVIHADGFLSIERATDLGKGLWTLNALALGARYGDPMSEFTDEIDAYVWTPANEPPAVLVKCVACLLYQCSEGDVPEQPLFKRMQRIRQSFEAVEKTPEYKAAPWGLPRYA